MVLASGVVQCKGRTRPQKPKTIALLECLGASSACLPKSRPILLTQGLTREPYLRFSTNCWSAWVAKVCMFEFFTEFGEHLCLRANGAIWARGVGISHLFVHGRHRQRSTTTTTIIRLALVRIVL